MVSDAVNIFFIFRVHIVLISFSYSTFSVVNLNIIILLLNCCTIKSPKNELNNEIKFPKKMTFNEFKLKLNQYAIISPYPDIKN